MSEHMLFVVASYAVALLVLGALGVLSWRGHASAKREVARLEALLPGRNR
jgi:heme exporter protein CcmD